MHLVQLKVSCLHLLVACRQHAKISSMWGTHELNLQEECKNGSISPDSSWSAEIVLIIAQPTLSAALRCLHNILRRCFSREFDREGSPHPPRFLGPNINALLVVLLRPICCLVGVRYFDSIFKKIFVADLGHSQRIGSSPGRRKPCKECIHPLWILWDLT